MKEWLKCAVIRTIKTIDQTAIALKRIKCQSLLNYPALLEGWATGD